MCYRIVFYVLTFITMTMLWSGCSMIDDNDTTQLRIQDYPIFRKRYATGDIYKIITSKDELIFILNEKIKVLEDKIVNLDDGNTTAQGIHINAKKIELISLSTEGYIKESFDEADEIFMLSSFAGVQRKKIFLLNEKINKLEFKIKTKEDDMLDVISDGIIASPPGSFIKNYVTGDIYKIITAQDELIFILNEKIKVLEEKVVNLDCDTVTTQDRITNAHRIHVNAKEIEQISSDEEGFVLNAFKEAQREKIFLINEKIKILEDKILKMKEGKK